MGEGIRVELTGALAGHHIVVDEDALTVGLLEDLDSGKVATIIAAVAGVIIGGDLPNGQDAAAIRKMRMSEFKALIGGVKDALNVPLAS